MSSRGYWPAVTYEPRRVTWLARRGTASRILLAMAFGLAGSWLISLGMFQISSAWPSAKGFALAAAMLLGAPLGAVATGYCLGLIFQNPNPPRWQL